MLRLTELRGRALSAKFILGGAGELWCVGFTALLVSHLGSPGIGPFGNLGNSENLVAMVAGDAPGIFIRILNILFINPEKLFTFRAFFNKFRHRAILFNAGIY